MIDGSIFPTESHWPMLDLMKRLVHYMKNEEEGKKTHRVIELQSDCDNRLEDVGSGIVLKIIQLLF